MSATNSPLRSADEYESAFNRLVKPRIGKLSVYEVRRSHVNKMLDEIEDANGPVMADRTLAYPKEWYAARDDQFNVFADFLTAHPGDHIPPMSRKQERLTTFLSAFLGTSSPASKGPMTGILTRTRSVMHLKDLRQW